MLDTSIVSGLIHNPAGLAAQRARGAGSAPCVSVIMAAELRYGCAKEGSRHVLHRVEAFLSQVPVLPFDVPADGEYRSIRGELDAAGRSIGSNDLLTAAHARALGATVVTASVREFRCVRGLNVGSWLA